MILGGRRTTIAALLLALAGSSCRRPGGQQPPVAHFDHAIVVLGCAANVDGSPTPPLERRLETALAAANEDPAAIVIVTGGAVHDAMPEGVAMHDWLIAHGLPERRVLVEKEALSTVQNCRFVTSMLEPLHVRRVTVVTEAYHLPRGMALMREAIDESGISPGCAVDGDAAPDLLEGDAKAAKEKEEQAALARDLAFMRVRRTMPLASPGPSSTP